MQLSQSKQLIVVDACLHNGHLFNRKNGRILCKNGFSMRILSNQKSNELLIPYPVADTWYLSLEARCFSKRYNTKSKRFFCFCKTKKTDFGILNVTFFFSLSVVCDTNKIPIIVNIHLRQCTYAGNNSCGLNGFCHNLQHGLLYYSSCECFGGKVKIQSKLKNLQILIEY